MSGDYDYLGSPEFREQRQRQRLCSAFVQAISDHGYEETTVARVAQMSGCSQQTFHRYYDGLSDLFCDACSHTLQESRSATVTAWLTTRGWSERLRHACHALLCHVEEHPAAARAVLVASLSGGPEVAQHVRETVAFHERALVMAFQLHPGGFATSRLTPRALTGGMRHAIYVRMSDGRERQIAELADDLHEWIECHRSTAAARLPIHQRMPQQPDEALAALAGRRGGSTTPAPADTAECDRVSGVVAQLMLQEGRDTLDDATVARFAGISSARFVSEYQGLQCCATQLVDRFIDDAIAALLAGTSQGRDWPESVRLGIVGCLRHLDSSRALTRLTLMRLSLVPAVAESRHAALAQRIVSSALQQAPPTRAGGALITDALVGAVNELLTWMVAGGMFARLPALANHISFFLLAPYLGGEAAAEAVIASADSEWLGRSSATEP